ncbi:hypothetical protein XELAEV_18019338mg [Xenopus laevis]|uniref:Uncharacterized protein n=1 Tax=Xenopus laevis TaxID=8355 RepID=A0A974HUQ9_XENLA|nr:hypothetical protein XELAEV_18019338mg [Xenopus laevis]
MTHWRKKGSGRRTLLLLVLLALVLGGTALCLASVNLLLTTTGWGKTLRQGQVLLHQDLPYQQLDTETQIYYQNVWEKQQYLYQKLREKSRPRRAAKDKKKRKPPLYAAHYEEEKLNAAVQESKDATFKICESILRQNFLLEMEQPKSTSEAEKEKIQCHINQ